MAKLVYYIFGRSGFVGFNGISLTEGDYYNSSLESTWLDCLAGITFNTGFLLCGNSMKKQLCIFDCPSDTPCAAGSITKTLNGKTIYFPCNEDGMKEAAGRGLYKNEVATFHPYDDYMNMFFTSGGVLADEFFDDCYLRYYPMVDGVEGDVNGDGAADVADIAMIINIMANE